MSLSSIYFKYFQIHILGHLFQKIKKERNLSNVKMSWYSQRFLNYVKEQNVSILPNCIHWNHYSVKIYYIYFSHLLTCKNSTIFWNVALLVLILHLSFFKCFAFFQVYYVEPKVWQYFHRWSKNLSWLV